MDPKGRNQKPKQITCCPGKTMTPQRRKRLQTRPFLLPSLRAEEKKKKTCSQNKPFLPCEITVRYCLLVDGEVTGCFTLLWLSGFGWESEGEGPDLSLLGVRRFPWGENYQPTHWLALIRINLPVFSSAGEVCGVRLSGHAYVAPCVCVCVFACIHSSDYECVCVSLSRLSPWRLSPWWQHRQVTAVSLDAKRDVKLSFQPRFPWRQE